MYASAFIHRFRLGFEQAKLPLWVRRFLRFPAAATVAIAWSQGWVRSTFSALPVVAVRLLDMGVCAAKAFQPAGRRGNTDATCQLAPTAGGLANGYITLARVGLRVTLGTSANRGNRTRHGANVGDAVEPTGFACGEVGFRFGPDEVRFCR
jgi:hypothetical protein